jgi:hypothetical protein
MLAYRFFIVSLYRIYTERHLTRKCALYNLTISCQYLIRIKNDIWGASIAEKPLKRKP